MPEDSPPQPIADALVLSLTRGMSLARWERLGLLEREWALYQHLAEAYPRYALLSYGDPDEEAALATRLTPSPAVICAPDAPDAPLRVARSLEGARSAVVKTNQMEGVGPAIRVAKFLRAAGLRTALIARGGYLRSRFAADQSGAGSKQAADAAAEEHALCTAADVIIGTTPDMTHALGWRYGVGFERTFVVPNFVLAEGSTRCAHERDPVVLYAGQLVKRKRVDLLIRAMARLSRESADRLTLSIIGEGPDEPALRALAAELGVRATFEPRLGHGVVLDRMRRAAFYAQASTLEGHPKTVIEAMACGAAVIVTDSPGMGEVITHGVTGLRVEPSEGGLADAIDLLLNDEAWREQLGHAAAHVAQEKFGLARIVPLEMAAHRTAMETAGSRAPADPSVRWDPSLPDAGPAAAEAWARALTAFARRLASDDLQPMLERLERTTREMREQLAGSKRAST